MWMCDRKLLPFHSHSVQVDFCKNEWEGKRVDLCLPVLCLCVWLCVCVNARPSLEYKVRMREPKTNREVRFFLIWLFVS